MEHLPYLVDLPHKKLLESARSPDMLERRTTVPQFAAGWYSNDWFSVYRTCRTVCGLDHGCLFISRESPVKVDLDVLLDDAGDYISSVSVRDMPRVTR
jgi:hypothetical protein